MSDTEGLGTTITGTQGITVRVEATAAGFYGNERRRVGDVFDLARAGHFSLKWMRLVAATTPMRRSTGQDELDRMHDERVGPVRRVCIPIAEEEDSHGRSLTMDDPTGTFRVGDNDE